MQVKPRVVPLNVHAKVVYVIHVLYQSKCMFVCFVWLTSGL